MKQKKIARIVISVAPAFFAISALANVIGTDLQNFNSTTNGLDFVTVQSSKTLDPGVLNLGLFFNYGVNTLPYFEGTAGQNQADIRDSLTGMDANLGLGLMKNWDVGISFPFILSQSVDGLGTHGQFAQNGWTEFRANTKVRLFGGPTGGVALIGSMNLNQIENNPFVGQSAGPIYNLEAAGDIAIDNLALGVNAGYRWRNPGTAIVNSSVEPFRNQMIASMAASYHIPSADTKLIFEVFGSMPAVSTTFDSDRKQSSLEALLGLKYDITSRLAFHFGGGTELDHGTATPDWRVYTGINYTFGPLWEQKQNVKQTEPAPLPEPEPENINDPFAGNPKAPLETYVVRNILFDFDSDHLRAESRDVLSRLANYLRKPPVFDKLEIYGHTDSVGSDTYNLELSQKRANSVKDFLVEKLALPAGKIVAVGLGEKFPVSSNANYQGRNLNRRVEFKIFRDMSHKEKIENSVIPANPPMTHEPAVLPVPAKPATTKVPSKNPSVKSKNTPSGSVNASKKSVKKSIKKPRQTQD